MAVTTPPLTAVTVGSLVVQSTLRPLSAAPAALSAVAVSVMLLPTTIC